MIYLKTITHIFLVVLSVIFSIILFSQFSDTLFNKGVYILFAITLEMFKIYLLVEAKFYLAKLKGYIFLGIALFIVYLGLAAISAIATLGFNLNTIEGQSFSAVVTNQRSSNLLHDIEAINRQIDTKTRQQSELPGDYVTASERFSTQILALQTKRNELIGLLEQEEREVVANDTFSLLGTQIGLTGQQVLYIILGVLTILLEIGIAITSGNISTKKKVVKEHQMAGFLEIPKEKPLPRVPAQKRAAGCESCLAYRECQYPKIATQGKGNRRVLVLFDAPTRREDHRKSPFDEVQHRYIFSILEANGYKSTDIWVRHAVQCYAKDISSRAIEGCHHRLIQEITELKPTHILVCGGTAMKVLYNNVNSGRFSFASYHKFPGFIIPDQELKAVIIPILSPEDTIEQLLYRRKNILMRQPDARFNKNLWEDKQLKKSDSFRVLDRFTKNQIRNGLASAWEKTNTGEIRVIDSLDESISVLRYLLTVDMFAFDTETTGLKPYAEGHGIIYWGFTTAEVTYSFPHFDDERFIKLMRRVMTCPARKIGANIKFEHNWIRHHLGVEITNWYFDIVIGAHVLDNREGITSLKFQTFVNEGVAGYDHEMDIFLKAPEKGGNSINNIDKAPPEKALWYVALDASYTFRIAKKMIAKLKTDKIRSRGYKLFHEGQLALADMEFRGFKIDTIQLVKNYRELEKKEKILYNKIKQSESIRDWPSFNPNSQKDLVELFYNRLKYPVDERTKSGEPSTKSEVIENFYEVHGVEIAKDIAEYKDVLKTKDTFLMGIRRETDNNVIHPSFSLNLVSSYRSSSQDPNFQNLPKRNKEAMTMIKSVMQPREGFVIMDVDYVSLEGFMGCNYHRDSMMETYLMDENTDMHSDMAEDLFMCKREDIDSKFFDTMRRVGKTANFALQYGSSAYKLGQNLWNSHLTFEHKNYLMEKGIGTYDAWVDHCNSIYRIYWEERFSELNQWRLDSWEEYIKTGESISNMGFIYNSVMSKNQVNNFRIQGSGFNILMRGINLMNSILKERKMKSGFIAEVHDSIVLEVAIEEIEEVKELVRQCFIVKIKEENPWIVMPLRMSGEIYRENWAENDVSADFLLSA